MNCALTLSVGKDSVQNIIQVLMKGKEAIRSHQRKGYEEIELIAKEVEINYTSQV